VSRLARRGIALTVLVAALQFALGAATADEELRDPLSQALDAYAASLEERDRDARLAGFARAERLFASVAESGAHSAALQTNLGSAALQAEHRGHAVLAYRRALELDSDFPRALQNLEHVRTLLPGWVPRPEPAGLLDTFFFYRALPRADRAIAAGGAFALGGLLIGLSIRLRQGALRGSGALALMAWALLAGSTCFDGLGGFEGLRGRSETASSAVVTSDDVLARSADSTLAPLAFPEPLPGGTEVTLIELRSPWARVRLANGRDAWVNESSVTLVTP